MEQGTNGLRTYLAMLCAMMIAALSGASGWAYSGAFQAVQTDAAAAFAMEAAAEVIIELPTPEPGFHVEVIRQTPAPEKPVRRILIYHTHTYEAFAQNEASPYEETERWRTRDEGANIVAVGNALAASLTALGFEVVHDPTAFEPPDLAGSYARSLKMLEARLEAGEHYDLYIDLHRDAIAASSTLKRTVTIGGQKVARFMVLVGQGSGAAYDVKPDWEQNCVLAQAITDALNQQHAELCRDVKLKTGRFNQHIAPCCVLIECGNNYNTLEEVLCGVPYLAQAIAQALGEQ